MEERNIIIIGSGPAGLTAAIYNARANLKPLVLAGLKWGGQLQLTTDVENYPGFVEGIQGPELMKIFREQAARFGAEIVNTDVSSVDFGSRPFKVTAGTKTYSAKAVIIATGAEARMLGLSNEKQLLGKGVSTCAPCDAWFFKDKKVAVVGGGDSAMEEALTLTKFASEVTIIHRREEFRASKIMLDRARKNKKIKFMTNAEIAEIKGQNNVEGLKIKDKKNGLEKELIVDGVFMAIGHIPITNIFKNHLELDNQGYILKKPQGEGPGKMQMMTSVEGVFVAGDVHDYHYRQAVTAAGYGCQAALEAERWVEAQD